MATASTIMLKFSKEVSVTVHGDGRWEAPGDPHAVLSVDSGKWDFWAPAATRLLSNTGDVQVVLQGWRLSQSVTGDSGDAVLYTQPLNDLGSYKVTDVF